MNREEIESQVWEYIDGTCNDADKPRIAQLVANDTVWKEVYNELRTLHAGISASIELEQPSMRFTKSVMDEVAKAHTAKAASRYINLNIVRGIAAFFMLVLLSALGYAFATAGYNKSGSAFYSNISAETGALFNSTTLDIILAVNVVLALVLLDKMLRKRRTTPAHE